MKRARLDVGEARAAILANQLVPVAVMSGSYIGGDKENALRISPSAS